MDKFVIEGLRRLEGEVKIQGAKNSALPILAAAAATGKTCIIHNCPRLSDIEAAMEILRYIGCSVDRAGETVIVSSADISRFDIPEGLMREMRSSIAFLGPLIARFGKAVLSSPGGCEIGMRPIDLHISSFETLGAEIENVSGRLSCSCQNGLHGAKIMLSFPSVGATENIMVAAASAKGTTTIINAAREPEIVDLADFLIGCGAKIHGAGEGTVVIEGETAYHSYEHTVIPDRIVASTYMAAAAVTRGHVLLKNVNADHISPVMSAFKDAGCCVRAGRDTLEVTAPDRLQRIGTVRTMPYPGFPTDSQAIVMVMAALARGTSVIVENIFENRYKYAGELIRMGARIKVENRVAIVEGVPKLIGAQTTAADLRGGTALVLAGLAAEGRTTVRGIQHIDRGCQRLEDCLTSMGAYIKREKDL
ncbi:MAG: UDP-N-acetylglucosamine 1-carboxyvinyltransferase [Oscillospiraceae bacterium]|nr:UDP-N-acetylglucosamine 1-carboxyvinyltransferase [Oscillospiraceae bacterium]